MKQKKTPVWVVCLMFLFMMWLFMSTCFGQRIVGPDTTKATFMYIDTSCHYYDVQRTINNRCVKEIDGYIVYWMYSTEFLDVNMKPFNFEVWFYKKKL